MNDVMHTSHGGPWSSVAGHVHTLDGNRYGCNHTIGRMIPCLFYLQAILQPPPRDPILKKLAQERCATICPCGNNLTTENELIFPSFQIKTRPDRVLVLVFLSRPLFLRCNPSHLSLTFVTARVGPMIDPRFAPAIIKPKADFAVSTFTDELTKAQKRDTQILPKDSIAQYDIQPGKSVSNTEGR